MLRSLCFFLSKLLLVAGKFFFFSFYLGIKAHCIFGKFSNVLFYAERFFTRDFALFEGGGSRLDGNALHRDRCDLYLVRFTGHARKSERAKCQMADIPDSH